MEALLRLWGAEEAARRQNLPPAPPVLKPVRMDLRYALVCAGCIAAGAVVAIGALLLAQHSGEPQAAEAAQHTNAVEPASDDALMGPPLPGAAHTQPHVVPAAGDSDLPALEKKLADTRSRLEQAVARAAQADVQRKLLADENADLQKQLEQVRRMKEAVARLNQKVDALRKEQDEALAMANRLRKQLAAHREQNQAKLQQMLDVHLQALAPNQQGLEAIQTAARTSSLLQRCVDLRAKETDKKTRKLLDRIEAELLRMDFLDTGDVTNMIRFEHQLRRSDLPADVAASLPQASQNRDLQIFLAEVDLILSGVQRAG